MDHALLRRIVARYPTASAWDRFHLRQRLQRCPYESLLPFIPQQGRLLDIGCGFAHFGCFLRETRPGLDYWGADIDTRKIGLAQATSLRVFAGDVRAWPGLPRHFIAVTMLDVLYLLPDALQKELFDFACGRLERSAEAVLVLKVLPPLKGWWRWQTLLQESAMVRLGKTRDSGALHCSQDPSTYMRWATEHGLQSKEVNVATTPPSRVLVFTIEGAAGNMTSQ